MKKKDYSKELMTKFIIEATETEKRHLEDAPNVEVEKEYCDNIKALAEAYAAINGWG